MCATLNTIIYSTLIMPEYVSMDYIQREQRTIIVEFEHFLRGFPSCATSLFCRLHGTAINCKKTHHQGVKLCSCNKTDLHYLSFLLSTVLRTASCAQLLLSTSQMRSQYVPTNMDMSILFTSDLWNPAQHLLALRFF
jgi:hypothetical protein